MKKLKKTQENFRVCPRCKGRGKIRPSVYRTKGYPFEHRVRHLFREHGWDVYRSYASRGVIDLLVEKNGRRFGIQCKNRKTGSYLLPRERSDLNEFFKTFEMPSSTVYQMSVYVPASRTVQHVSFQAPIATLLAYNRDGKISFERLIAPDKFKHVRIENL